VQETGRYGTSGDWKLEQGQRSTFVNGIKPPIAPRQKFKVMAFTPLTVAQVRSGELGGDSSRAVVEDDQSPAERAQGHENGGDRGETVVQHVEVSLLLPWHHCPADFDLAAFRPHILKWMGKDAGPRSFQNLPIFRCLQSLGLVIARPSW
jgi:hypothetical protein